MEQREFSPVIELDHSERALLTQTVNTEGYRIMHRVIRSEVDKLFVDLINADPSEHKDVLAKHNLAKSAAVFYTQITDRINYETIQYTAALRATDTPKDATENVLDIGERADQVSEFQDPMLFEEGVF